MKSIANIKKGQTDAKLKEDGVWHDIFIPGDAEPLRLKLRSLGSNKARLWDIARFREQRGYYLNDGTPPIEVIDKNEVDKLAEALLVDWNIVREDGSPEPLTIDCARDAMTQLPDVRRSAFEAAGKNEAYRLKEVAAIAKNSGTPSTEISGTGAKAE